jgi:hypothetical protein
MLIRIFILLAFCNNGCGFAQQYLIRFDLANENGKYFQIRKKGDTVQVPVINISRSGNVNLYLQNIAASFTDSIGYEVKAETNEAIQNPWWGGTSNGITGSPFIKNIPGLSALGIAEIIKEKKEKGFEIMGFDGGRSALDQYVAAYNKFTTAYNNWSKSALFDGECYQLWKDLVGLRYSIHQPAEELKKFAQSKTKELFPAIQPNTSLLQLYEMAGSADSKKAFAELQSAYNHSKLLAEDENLHANNLVDSTQLFAKKLMQLAGNYSGTVSSKDAGIEKIGNLYLQIMQDTYSRNHTLQIDKNTSSVVLTLKPIFEPGDSLTKQILQLKENASIRVIIPVYKKSPIRFRNTYGLSFVFFSENKWRYFVKTTNNINTIDRETADYFQPVISSFLHFYSPRDKGFRWGGSFGAGVPVGNNLETKLNILLGLSTFLGKNDPLVITIGCAGTKVNKLSGYRLGDTVPFTELDASKNFNSVYRIGYYLSVTFNPYGINAKN